MANSHEVWIGEFWWQLWFGYGPDVCYPDFEDVRPDEPAEPEVHTERVLLLLWHDAQRQLRGRIQFGEGSVPTEPDCDPPQPDDPEPLVWCFYNCSAGAPARGFEYSLVNVRQTDTRLTFELPFNELWAEWCTTQTKPSNAACECRDERCWANLIPTLQFDLAFTRDTLEGSLPRTIFGGVRELRLRRVE